MLIILSEYFFGLKFYYPQYWETIRFWINFFFKLIFEFLLPNVLRQNLELRDNIRSSPSPQKKALCFFCNFLSILVFFSTNFLSLCGQNCDISFCLAVKEQKKDSLHLHVWIKKIMTFNFDKILWEKILLLDNCSFIQWLEKCVKQNRPQNSILW